ncbi:hypothetical protein T11_11189, partial [Trichinella zimbabwensis]
LSMFQFKCLQLFDAIEIESNPKKILTSKRLTLIITKCSPSSLSTLFWTAKLPTAKLRCLEEEKF